VSDAVLRALGRYWPHGSDPVMALPLPDCQVAARTELPPRLTAVSLPDWSSDLGELLVPSHAVLDGEGESWTRTDWLGAAEWYVTCAAERAHERVHGPLHSYSFRLRGWDPRMWRSAWANRIALFLRRWAARAAGRDEEALFGPLPDAEIIVTHDVDAVAKPMSLRIKQAAFHAFNSARKLRRGEGRGAARKAGHALKFFFRPGDLWNFETITALEEKHGIRSHFNFYGGSTTLLRPLRRTLVDPAYDVTEARLRSELGRLRDGGWTIGLHQSFDAWRDPDMMRAERLRVESAAGIPVTSCRQHWLRFSFAETWRAQAASGFVTDTTLGFNDRPAFRNGAALRWKPLDDAAIESLPMVAMDSHFYDYADLSAEERRRELAHWVGEIRAVRGVATVLWHQQVIGDDYGWGDGFNDLLESVCNDRAA